MQKTILCAFIILLHSAALNAQPGGSYVKLKGKRLSRFYSSAGRSEVKRRISLTLPPRVFPVRDTGKSLWINFQHKGVRFLIKRSNPYWIQTRRKLRKSSSGGVLVKGRVLPGRKHEGDRATCVLIDTLQKRLVKQRKKKKQGKS